MQKHINQYKYLSFLIMLYMTIKLTTVMFIYKIIAIGSFTASASTLIMPSWFIMRDVIAEFYGVTSFSNLLHLMTISYVVKLILHPILIIPSMTAAYALKKLENVDIYDYRTNFNPFKVGIEDNESISLQIVNKIASN